MARHLEQVNDLDWTAYVRPGDRVLWGQACAEPPALTESLLDSRHAIGAFSCFVGVPSADTCRPEHADVVKFESYTAAGANRSLWRAGSLDILPAPYSSLPSLFRSRRFAIDVVLLMLPPPDRSGRYTMGLADEYVSAALDSARVVIAEVSERVPRVTGSRQLSDQDLDVIVYSDGTPLPLMRQPPTGVQLAVGRRVAELVEDGSTLQVGIGALPDAVLQGLAGHHRLGVHTGAFTDSLAQLTEAGVITNECKPKGQGVSVAGVVMGGEIVLEHVRSHHSVELRPTDYTHSPTVLAAQYKLVTLNAALEVDLTGQVNSEVAAGEYVGAYGGACDFAVGARYSTGGLPIVMLTSKAGSASRIVSRLDGPVSTPRGEVGIVVTEHGAADLRGLTLAQRRAVLLGIADPEFRDALERAQL